jgi:hypothetical protein
MEEIHPRMCWGKWPDIIPTCALRLDIYTTLDALGPHWIAPVAHSGRRQLYFQNSIFGKLRSVSDCIIERKKFIGWTAALTPP